VKDHRHRTARVRKAEQTMTKSKTKTKTDDSRIDAEVKAVRGQYAEEEAEAAEAEIAETDAALDVPLNLRITKDLDAHLRRRATAKQILTSALVLRLLTLGIHEQLGPGRPA